jgi:hypothetical protein
MTHEGDVLVWDGQSIRRIVVDANGIPDLLETVTDAPPGSCHACNIVALPGGDFYFVNGLGLPGVSGWRIYRSTGGVVGAIAPSGTGYSGDPAAQIGTCLLRDLFVSYDPADGSVRRLHAAVLASGDCALYGYVSMDAAGVSVTTEDAAAVHLPFPSLTSSFAFTGLDGFVYGYWESGDSQLTRFDNRTSVSLDVLGSSGSLAQGCASGTPALECDARAHDVFVGPDGGVLWSSLGRIRAIEFDGRAVDFLGQSLDYGEDGDALAVRIAYSSTLGVWNDGLNERVTYLDNVNARIREAIVGGNVLRRAGNGVLGLPQAGGSDAPNEPLYLHAYSSFLQDPDGTIYLPSFQQILSNTDPASPWQTFAGLGEIPYWQADDDTPGDQLLLDFYDAIPFGSTPNRVAFAMLRWSGVEFTDGMVKSFARSDGALRHVAGVDGGIGPTSADGVSRTECSLFMHYYVWARTRAVYDAPRARWIWQGSWGDDEFLLFDDDGDGGPPGALKGSLGAQLGLASLRSWTYRFEDPYDVLYVCNGEGRLAKATLDGGVWTIQALPWPIASLSCAGQDLAWSSDGKRLVFPYRQFGLGGIAAYVIDP